jgi:hypothetical protein
MMSVRERRDSVASIFLYLAGGFNRQHTHDRAWSSYSGPVKVPLQIRCLSAPFGWWGFFSFPGFLAFCLSFPSSIV